LKLIAVVACIAFVILNARRSLNVAHLVGAYEDNEVVDLVLQLCTGGTLW
jgi:hypothetical protein